MPEKVELWSKKKVILAYVCFPVIWLFILFERTLAFFVPIKRNRISIYVHRRRGFSCNPKYIAEKLLETKPGKYEIFWITRYPETCKRLGNKSIKVVKELSIRDFVVRLTSRVMISNDNLYVFYLKRRDQLYINTWHGAINYKKVGYESLKFRSKIQETYFHLNNRQPDVYVAGTDFFIHDMAKSFCFPESIFVPTGLPRNDLFFQRVNLKEQIKNKLGIPLRHRVVTYAPTYRTGNKVDDFGIDYAAVINSLEEKYQEKFTMLFRSHAFVEDTLTTLNANKSVIDVSQYDDMQEILYVSDILISDYSSCMWDFSLMERPCFVFAPDLENYIQEDRAFAYPLERWPYMIAKNNSELLNNIINFDESHYRERLAEHHRDAGRYDQGNSSMKLVKIIEDYCQ